MCCFVFIFQLLRIYLCILFYFILCILKIDDGEHQISVLYFKDKLFFIVGFFFSMKNPAGEIGSAGVCSPIA